MKIDNTKKKEIRDAVDLLERAVDRFAVRIGKPIFVVEKEKDRFRYSQQNPIIIQVLKAVRVVSGLNASVHLLEGGFVQEIGVLIRTIDDFLKEIAFVQEALTTKSPTADQKLFLEQFFSEELLSPSELLIKDKKANRVKRKKIVSAGTRLLLDGKIKEELRKGLEVVGDIYSGYVHGAYPHIMEMYEGGVEGFAIRGTTIPERFESYLGQIACYVHRSLNTFSMIANNFNFIDLRDELIEKRRKFEESKVYREW